MQPTTKSGAYQALGLAVQVAIAHVLSQVVDVNAAIVGAHRQEVTGWVELDDLDPLLGVVSRRDILQVLVQQPHAPVVGADSNVARDANVNGSSTL